MISIYISPEVQSVIDLHGHDHRKSISTQSVYEFLSRLADELWHAYQNNDPRSTVEIKNNDPALVHASDNEIFSSQLSFETIQDIVARDHGFHRWKDLPTDLGFDLNFENTVDALLVGDLDFVKHQIDRFPELIRQRSSLGHRSTLLHYVAVNGIEIYRQIVPSNMVEIAKVLIENGAEMHATSNSYSGNQTVMNLLTSSSHPYKAGVGKNIEELFCNHL